MKTIMLSVLLIAASIVSTKAQYNAIFDFDSINGSLPVGDLISDGTFLYGMTFWGGTQNAGTIFKIKPDGTGFAKLHDFDGVANGKIPQGSLFSDGTFLYGMTSQGGTNGNGIIFKIKPDGTSFDNIFNFSNTTTGYFPTGALISDGTFLYGMANAGGTSDWGTVFKIKPDGTGFDKLHNFDGAGNGGAPNGALLSDGTFLYGMTGYGGASTGTSPCFEGCGTIFKIKPDGTEFTKLLDFDDALHGSFPDGSLLSDGTFLYGMTSEGGTNNFGTAFKIKPDGTGYVKLHDFTGADGNYPKGTLILDGDFLYGVANTGGTDTAGVLFKIKPDGTGFTNLHDFTAASGSFPSGSLISAGTFFYGLTSGGGLNEKGGIFKYQDSTATAITEHMDAVDAFSVYPNPTSGEFTIKWNGIQDVENEVEIYNVIGEKVYLTTDSEQSTINLNLPGGIYFIHVITERGTASRKMVVRH